MLHSVSSAVGMWRRRKRCQAGIPAKGRGWPERVRFLLRTVHIDTDPHARARPHRYIALHKLTQQVPWRPKITDAEQVRVPALCPCHLHGMRACGRACPWPFGCAPASCRFAGHLCVSVRLCGLALPAVLLLFGRASVVLFPGKKLLVGSTSRLPSRALPGLLGTVLESAEQHRARERQRRLS